MGTIAAISMDEYFPETGCNRTTVTWAHAVNSQQELEDAVRGKNTGRDFSKEFVLLTLSAPCTIYVGFMDSGWRASQACASA
jgi:hypothetical protein